MTDSKHIYYDNSELTVTGVKTVSDKHYEVTVQDSKKQATFKLLIDNMIKLNYGNQVRILLSLGLATDKNNLEVGLNMQILSYEINEFLFQVSLSCGSKKYVHKIQIATEQLKNPPPRTHGFWLYIGKKQ